MCWSFHQVFIQNANQTIFRLARINYSKVDFEQKSMGVQSVDSPGAFIRFRVNSRKTYSWDLRSAHLSNERSFFSIRNDFFFFCESPLIILPTPLSTPLAITHRKTTSSQCVVRSHLSTPALRHTAVTGPSHRPTDDGKFGTTTGCQRLWSSAETSSCVIAEKPVLPSGVAIKVKGPFKNLQLHVITKNENVGDTI